MPAIHAAYLTAYTYTVTVLHGIAPLLAALAEQEGRTEEFDPDGAARDVMRLLDT